MANERKWPPNRAAAAPPIRVENLGQGIAIPRFAATQPPVGENLICSACVGVTSRCDARQTAVFQDALRKPVGVENYFVTLR